MKNLFFALFVAFAFTAIPLTAENYYGPTKLSTKVYDDLSISGPAELKLVKAKTLVINGPTQFKQLDVSNNAEIHGPVRGSYGKFKHLLIRGPFDADHIISDHLDVFGEVKLTNFEIKQESTIHGNLEASHGTFDGITLASQKISLEDVTTGSINIEPSNEPPVLKLTGKTIVNGNINFESENGILDAASTVQINGAVKGAKKKG